MIQKPWVNTFIYGLVPPSDIDVANQCRGVAKVVTQRSFLNSVASILTFSIYTPLQVTTTCASARTASRPDIPLERLGYAPSDSTQTVRR